MKIGRFNLPLKSAADTDSDCRKKSVDPGPYLITYSQMLESVKDLNFRLGIRTKVQQNCIYIFYILISDQTYLGSSCQLGLNHKWLDMKYKPSSRHSAKGA